MGLPSLNATRISYYRSLSGNDPGAISCIIPNYPNQLKLFRKRLNKPLPFRMRFDKNKTFLNITSFAMTNQVKSDMLLSGLSTDYS